MGLTIVKYIQRKWKSVAKAIMHGATRKRLFEYLVFHFPICLCLMIFVIVSIVVILLTHVLVVNNSKQNNGLKTNSMVVKVYSHKTDTIIHTLPPERKENTPKELLEISKNTQNWKNNFFSYIRSKRIEKENPAARERFFMFYKI